MDINKRHRMILDAIISMYINSGEPIASSALRDALGISVSSATVRSEMARLTKLGYLDQPHVSSGRIPTNKAYRYYVENMEDYGRIDESRKERLKERFYSLDGDSDRFLAGAAKLFSDFLGRTVMIVPPVDPDMQFVNFTALKTARHSAALIATTKTGEVYTRVIRFGGDISDLQLRQLCDLLNRRLCFICYSDVDKDYFFSLCKNLDSENSSFSKFLTGALTLMERAGEGGLYVAGQEKLAESGRFDRNIADLLRLLSDREVTRKIITPAHEGVSVVFGDELPIKNLENACFISTKYHAGGAVSGAVSALCPRTVDYRKTFAAMDYFAGLLTAAAGGAERK